MEHPRHIVVVTALVRRTDDRILAVRHHRRGWELPQGRVEEGEALLDALHREVREETGLEVVPGPLAAVWSKLSPPAALVFGFAARSPGGAPAPSDETPEAAWLAADELLSRVAHPVNRERLTTLLAAAGEPVFKAYVTGPFRILSEKRLPPHPGAAAIPPATGG